jgi:hypothetical protein
VKRLKAFYKSSDISTVSWLFVTWISLPRSIVFKVLSSKVSPLISLSLPVFAAAPSVPLALATWICYSAVFVFT